MTAPACQHPDEAREPLPYDGRSVADPDDWRCAECGATNLRLDRRTYEERLRAAEAERLAEIEFERFEARQIPSYQTRTMRTREGDVEVVVPDMTSAMGFRDETFADVLDRLFRASGVPPALSQTIDRVDVTSVSDTMNEAITRARELVVEGGFDPARPDSDLMATIYHMRDVGTILLKRVDHVEMSHELFARVARVSGPASSLFSHDAFAAYTIMGWPLERKGLSPFAFRVVGS